MPRGQLAPAPRSATSRPPIEDRDPVGQPLDVGQVVARQQDRHALVPEPAEELAGRRSRLDVHAGGRLVEDRRARAGRPARGRARAAAARRPTGAGTASAATARGPTRLEQLVGVARRRVEPAVEAERPRAAVIRGSIPPPPWSISPTRARCRRPARAGSSAEDPDAARVGPPVALDDLDRRRLAGAVRAEQRERSRRVGPRTTGRRGRSGRRSASRRPATSMARAGRPRRPSRHGPRSARTGARSRRPAPRRSGSTGGPRRVDEVASAAGATTR